MAQEPQQQEETLGQRIRAKRKELYGSQDKLAEKVGVSSLTVLRWELDRSFPRGDDVQLALIEALGLPKDEFTKRKDLVKKQVETAPIKKGKEDEEALLIEKVEGQEKIGAPEDAEKDRGTFPVEIILPHQYWDISAHSLKESEDTEIVEYKIPPTIVYKGFYVSVFYEKYGYLEESRVTSNGKRLLPYDTWVNPDTVRYGWGNTGGGARHLAESILLDYFEIIYPNEQEEVLRSWAGKYSFNFKMDFTSWFDKREWEIWSGAITAWLKEERENGDPGPEHTLKDVYDGWTGWWKRWDKYKGT
jgi:transcriptional regulator with XRE-family HTH domain